MRQINGGAKHIMQCSTSIARVAGRRTAETMIGTRRGRITLVLGLPLSDVVTRERDRVDALAHFDFDDHEAVAAEGCFAAAFIPTMPPEMAQAMNKPD